MPPVSAQTFLPQDPPPGLAAIIFPNPDASFTFRKQKYFYKGGLVWDENSSDGRYVKENCKPLKVSFWLPSAQLMPRRPQALGTQAAKGCPPRSSSARLHPRLLGAGSGPLALPLPHRVAMTVIGEHKKSQISETLLLPAPSLPSVLGRTRQN